MNTNNIFAYTDDEDWAYREAEDTKKAKFLYENVYKNKGIIGDETKASCIKNLTSSDNRPYTLLFYDCITSQKNFDITEGFVEIFGIGKSDITCAKDPGIKIAELLNNTEAAKGAFWGRPIRFKPSLINSIHRSTFKTSRNSGNGEVMTPLLPMNSYYNNNDGTGDVSVNGHNFDLKSMGKYEDSSSPVVVEEDAINSHIKADLREAVIKCLYGIADKYQEIALDIHEEFNINLNIMLSPYEDFYTVGTYINKNSNKRKVYIFEKIFHKMGKFSEKITERSRRKQYIKDIKMAAKRLFRKIFVEILPDKNYIKKNEGLKQEIEELCSIYINEDFNPLNENSKLFKYEDKKEFKRREAFWGLKKANTLAKENNTCEFWHKYACLFFKRYLKKVNAILFMFMLENGRGCSIYIPSTAKNIDELSKYFSFIFPETHNSTGNRASIRLMPLYS
jgi:hypothetical protein